MALSDEKQRELEETTRRFAARHGGTVYIERDDSGKLRKIGVRFKGAKQLDDMPAVSKFLSKRKPDEIKDPD